MALCVPNEKLLKTNCLCSSASFIRHSIVAHFTHSFFFPSKQGQTIFLAQGQ